MTEEAGAFRVAPPLTPSLRRALASLLEADLIVQLRNGRALLLSAVLPLVLLFALNVGKRAAFLGGPTPRVASALMLGIATTAILGYSISVARDREAGVFQRLRVTPTPTWAIMISRLAIQAGSILVMAVLVLVAAAIFQNVSLDPLAYILTLVVVIFGAAEFLSVGQALVGLVRSSETVNVVGRVLYIPLFALGLLGHLNVFGDTVETVAQWSPGGALATMLAGSMHPSTWSADTWLALLASIIYSAVFAGIGIRWFQWTAR